MLKFVESCITFSEFPDEISLVFSLSQCPNKCPGCSEPYLSQDIGTILDEQTLDGFINKNKGITLVGFLGGDNDHEQILNFARYIHKQYGLLVGMYSGRDFINIELAKELDYYKIGRFILPEGDVTEWPKKTCGPIVFPFSNQIIFKRTDNKMINITERLRSNPINNLSSYIIN